MSGADPNSTDCTGVVHYLKTAARDVERALDQLLPLPRLAPERELYFAMRYSLFAGGKRLRPALFFAALEAFGRERTPFLPFAAALEMIHTYSLIHDDLPAMDDDDLRRGQPTCHVRYGEALAILAGDALLTHAFALMLQPMAGAAPADQMAAAREVAWQAGIGGMVAGQAAEIVSLQSEVDEGLLTYIYQGKTSALFAAAVVSAAHLCGAAQEEIAALREYAKHLGLGFQIIDDVLDVEGDTAKLGKPVGSDEARELTTFVTLYGCEAARQRAAQEAEAARCSLDIFGGSAAMLRQFPALLAERDH